MNGLLRPAAAALLFFGLSVGAAAEKLLITNVDIDTMTSSGRLLATDVLIEDGKVVRIGEGLPRADASVIDGEGRRLTPGIFNAFTQLGVVEINQISQTNDSAATNEDVSASLKVVDGFNHNSTLLPHNAVHGLTHALVAPTNGQSLFAGVVSVVNLSGSATDSIEKDAVGVLLNYNESAAAAAGGSRGAALAVIRRALTDTLDYAASKERYLSGEGRDLSLGFDDLDALVPVIQGKQYLFVKVHRSADILRVLELGEQYKLKLILVGVEEGWMVAPQIAMGASAVILDPALNIPESYEKLGARLDNAALLHRAGVRLMFTGMESANPNHNAYSVTQNAGLAAANGLPYEAALAAVSSTPAEVFDLTVGQVLEGARADLVLWSGEPLELLNEAEMVFVNGTRIPMVSRSTRLRDRYFSRLKEFKES